MLTNFGGLSKATASSVSSGAAVFLLKLPKSFRNMQALAEHRKLCAREGARLKALKAGGRHLHAAHTPAWFELLDARDAPGVTPPGQQLKYRFKQGQQSFWAAYERGDWGACPNVFDP